MTTGRRKIILRGIPEASVLLVAHEAKVWDYMAPKKPVVMPDTSYTQREFFVMIGMNYGIRSTGTSLRSFLPYIEMQRKSCYFRYRSSSLLSTQIPASSTPFRCPSTYNVGNPKRVVRHKTRSVECQLKPPAAPDSLT